MQKRNVPLKNYIIFAIVALISFVTVYNIARWYKDVKKEYENKSIMSKIVSEIYENEIDSYIIENESFVLYLSSAVDSEVKSFENSFKNLVVKEDISDEIIYVDTNKITNADFYQILADKHFSDELKNTDIKLNVLPNVVYFKEHKIQSILYGSIKKIDIDTVEQFLINNEVIEQ